MLVGDIAMEDDKTDEVELGVGVGDIYVDADVETLLEVVMVARTEDTDARETEATDSIEAETDDMREAKSTVESVWLEEISDESDASKDEKSIVAIEVVSGIGLAVMVRTTGTSSSAEGSEMSTLLSVGKV
jgi:hypothetical protein